MTNENTSPTIWSSYAYDNDREDKYRQNQNTYQKYAPTVSRVYNLNDANQTHQQHPDHTIIGVLGGKYSYTTYRIYHNPQHLTIPQLALICDQGDLRFGYHGDGEYITISNE